MVSKENVMKRTRMVGQLFAGVALFCVFSPAFSAVFSVGPGSSIDISGTIAIDINVGGVSSPGSGSLVEQGPGGLHSNLSGLLNANVSGSDISFVGGKVFNALPSGTWQPNGSPAAFGFQIDIPLVSGPLAGNSIKLVGDIRDLSFFLTGTRPLSGAPGNQTFDTAGLELTTLGGTTDLQTFLCPAGQPNNCMDFGTQTIPPDNSGPPDILPSGTGTLVLSGSKLTLPLLIQDTESDTQTDVVEGIPVTTTLTADFTLRGNVVASMVPEASAWAMLCVGLAGIGLMWRRMRMT